MSQYFHKYTLLLLAIYFSHSQGVKMPSFKKKEYTPLVFFKTPPGIIDGCDQMEKVVRQVEKELGVRVERLDILRDPKAEAVLALLTRRPPPFLYHRESCQVIYLPNLDSKQTTKDMATYIDKDRIRAWAKGRHLPPQRTTSTVNTPVVLSQKDQSLDQEEILR